MSPEARIQALEHRVSELEKQIIRLVTQQQPTQVYGPVFQPQQVPLDIGCPPWKITCDTSKLLMNDSDCDGGSRAGWENES